MFQRCIKRFALLIRMLSVVNQVPPLVHTRLYVLLLRWRAEHHFSSLRRPEIRKLWTPFSFCLKNTVGKVRHSARGLWNPRGKHLALPFSVHSGTRHSLLQRFNNAFSFHLNPTVTMRIQNFTRKKEGNARPPAFNIHISLFTTSFDRSYSCKMFHALRTRYITLRKIFINFSLRFVNCGCRAMYTTKIHISTFRYEKVLLKRQKSSHQKWFCIIHRSFKRFACLIEQQNSNTSCNIFRTMSF